MRVLMIGLDGLDRDLHDELAAAGELPRLAALARGGGSGPLAAPAAITPVAAWTSILTGVDPGRHGLWDLTARDGYQVVFSAGARRESPNVFEILSSAGRSVVTVGFPGTHPPLPVEGVILSGPDAPGAVHGRRAGCLPAELHERLVRRFGEDHLLFDPLDSLPDEGAPGPDWYRKAVSRLRETMGRRIELAAWIVGRFLETDPDVVAVHFPEADAAGRRFWHLHDLNSPLRPSWIDDFIDDATGRVADPVADVYRALDAAVGELVDRLRPDHVVVVSDHALAGRGTRLASLNRFLLDRGFARSPGPSTGAPEDILGSVGRLGLGLVPAELRDAIVSGVGAAVAGRMASRIRLGGLDWIRTSCFSEDLPHAPSIHLNEMGREPEGILHRSERTWWLKLLTEALEEWTAPAPEGSMPPGPRRVVRRVHLGEDLYRGPRLDRIPDLLVELETDEGHALVLTPGAFRRMRAPVVPLPDDLTTEIGGPILPGVARPGGMYIVAPVGGAALESPPSGPLPLTAVAPVVLELAGHRVPGHFDGEPERVASHDVEWLDREQVLGWFDGARG